MYKKGKKRAHISYLPIYGCFSTGITYVAIGVIAILSFFKVKDGGADESSLIAFLNDFNLGVIVIWIIVSGTLCFIFWRIYESIKDPYGYGKDTKGLATRIGIALSTIPDALITYTAIKIMFGFGNIQISGQPYEERQFASNLLQEPWGKWMIIAIGLIILLTAIVQLLYGLTKGYKERLDIDQVSIGLKRIIHSLALSGYLARGIILGIIGFFYIKAGILEKAYVVVNTDKAFDFIGDHVGHVYFIVIAIGTICYGLFMFALGIAYDIDKD